jgi:hypothetical protein
VSSAEKGSPSPAPAPEPRALERYLTRPVTRSVYYLDHGVISTELAFGLPHIYRLGVSIGLLDHLTLGATTHWLKGQAAPGWSPLVSLAFFRGRRVELGASYFQLLHPPPGGGAEMSSEADDSADDGDSFQERTHYAFASVSLSQAWFTVGVDLGWARGRELDPFLEQRPPLLEGETPAPPYLVRDRLAGGLHARVGTRRLGLIARVLFPYTSFDLALSVRFGVFEKRARGEWWRW